MIRARTPVQGMDAKGPGPSAAAEAKRRVSGVFLRGLWRSERCRCKRSLSDGCEGSSGGTSGHAGRGQRGGRAVGAPLTPHPLCVTVVWSLGWQHVAEGGGREETRSPRVGFATNHRRSQEERAEEQVRLGEISLYPPPLWHCQPPVPLLHSLCAFYWEAFIKRHKKWLRIKEEDWKRAGKAL